ncbi:TetR/AcrR family transcriptional regulator [Oceanobacillus halotolerans]|uniref:TetR/AcrR family transcriptional regulator n=1 Tax=Oceanobacillus halotolerans TaxID=2663380 RepID=UPI0013DCA5CB|nr:TetR family transcriptional regulator [Oceanobacillus halotolerans]
MASSNTKQAIMNAAAQIIHQDGILEMTLESVAKQADLSKGGLLYHFPSKEDLVKGLVDHQMQVYMENIKAGAENDTTNKGKWTRSFIQETFRQSTSNKELDAGLLAAIAYDPNLLNPIQEAYQHWQQQIEEDELDPVKATILRLAVDGLWFSEIFGLAPLAKELKEEVLHELITLSKGE